MRNEKDSTGVCFAFLIDIWHSCEYCSVILPGRKNQSFRQMSSPGCFIMLPQKTPATAGGG